MPEGLEDLPKNKTKKGVTLEKILALDPSATSEFLNRVVPPGQRPQIFTSLDAIKEMKNKVSWTEPKRKGRSAERKLSKVNTQRRKKGQPEYTLDTIDVDELVDKLHVCRIPWAVRVLQEADETRHEWVDLAEPCRKAFVNGDGYLRHFKEEHLGRNRVR